MLTRYRIAAELIAVLGLVLGLIWGFHAYSEHERQIGRDEVQGRWDAQKAADKEAAVKDQARWGQQQVGAQNNATNREQINQAAAAAAGLVGNSLRDAITAFAKARPDDSAASARKDAATLGALLADCEGRYRGMAQIADGHASDVKTLKEAWPRNEEKAP